MEISPEIGPLIWQNCKCQVWVISAWNPVGSCGRCGYKPEGNYTTEEEAVAAYEKEHKV